MARPKKDIDAAEVQKLAAIQCTLAEMASFFDCDISTLSKRFSKEIAKGKEEGKISLRRLQFRHAEKSYIMAIWLGKQYLNQTEKIEKESDSDLINQELDFTDVPLNGDGEHRFSKFVN